VSAAAAAPKSAAGTDAPAAPAVTGSPDVAPAVTAAPDVDDQLAIARAGGIAPLVALVHEGTPDARRAAAGALWSIANDNAD